jgi:hypothetical protein
MFRVYGRIRTSGVVMGVFRRSPAFCVSLACHLTCFAALVLLMRQSARAPISTAAEADRAMPPMVWLKDPGPGGGGGGGGNRMKEPPRPVPVWASVTTARSGGAGDRDDGNRLFASMRIDELANW